MKKKNSALLFVIGMGLIGLVSFYTFNFFNKKADLNEITEISHVLNKTQEFAFAKKVKGDQKNIASSQFPEMIDFSRFQSTQENPIYEPDSWNLGYAAFNFAPEIIPFFLHLKNQHGIDTVVESGTYEGASTLLFSLIFENVHTIEINPLFHQKAKKNFTKKPNIQLHLGDSESVFAKILPLLKNKRILFYLDAHWEKHFPLVDEIRTIGKTHANNCIIVIDDFKVPGREEINFDRYGESSCSLEYIQSELKSVFGEYEYHFVIPKSIKSKAKFVCIPKRWRNSQ